MDSHREIKAAPNNQRANEIVNQLRELEVTLSDAVSFAPLKKAAILTCGHCFNEETLGDLDRCAICRDEDLEEVVLDYTVRQASEIMEKVDVDKVEKVFLQHQQLTEENKNLKADVAEYKII